MENPFKVTDEQLKKLLNAYWEWCGSDPKEGEYNEYQKRRAKDLRNSLLNVQFLKKAGEDELFRKVFDYSRTLEGPAHIRLGELRIRERLEDIKRNLLYLVESKDGPFEKAAKILEGDFRIKIFARSFWTPIFQAQYPEELSNWNNKTDNFMQQVGIDLKTRTKPVQEKYRVLSDAFKYLQKLDPRQDFYTLNHLMHFGTGVEEGQDLIGFGGKKEELKKRVRVKKKEDIIPIEEKQVGNFFKSLACSEPQPFFVAMGDTRNLQKLDSEDRIIYNTEFQRGEVWPLPKKQKLIDSILRGYNINTIFFRQLPDGRFECLDGQQRLKTILKEFLNDKFPINPKITPEFNRKTYFSEFPEFLKSKIRNYPIYAIIFYTEKDDETCKIFLRLQEGLPLNSAEKLNAMIGFLRNEIVELSKHRFMKKLGIKDHRFAHRYILAQAYLMTLRNQITDIKFRKNLREAYSTYKQTRPPQGITGTVKEILRFLDKSFNEDAKIIHFKADFISLYLLVKHLIENYVICDTGNKLKEFFIQFLIKVGEVESSENEGDVPYYDYKTYRKTSADSRNSIERRFSIILSKFLEFVPNIKPKDPTRGFNYWEKLAVYRRDQGICRMCGGKISFKEGSVDHKMPHSKGGLTTIANGQWLCRKCNLKKLDKIM